MTTKELIEGFKKVRPADISDALDRVNRQDTCVMDNRIRPIWQGCSFVGTAKTAKYTRATDTIPHAETNEEYDKYAEEWLDGRNIYSAFLEVIEDGDVLVFDNEQTPYGLWGSDVALTAEKKGLAGVVLDGGCRDSYEVALQESPVFCAERTPTHVIGRLDLVSINEPITCGGVLVRPGDIICADDDGVVVVPIEDAEKVLEYAQRELDIDKNRRKGKYEDLNRELDESVK